MLPIDQIVWTAWREVGEGELRLPMRSLETFTNFVFKTPAALKSYWMSGFSEKRDLFDVSWVYACNESALKDPVTFVEAYGSPAVCYREVNEYTGVRC